MNNWSFTGNLGKECEQRVTPNGDAIVSFSVAVKSGFGDKETTTWARCAMFGKRGEAVAPYLNKGQQVAIVGEVTLREYEKDGQKRHSLEVRVNDLTLIGGKPSSSDSAPQQRQEPQRQQQKPAQQSSGGSGGGWGDFDSDVPFIEHGHGQAWRVI